MMSNKVLFWNILCFVFGFAFTLDEYCNVSSPQYGATDCLETVNVTTVCNITCLGGYYLDNPESVTCVSQDTWDHDWNTSCKAITCSGEPVLESGNDVTDCSASNSIYMETCDLMCNDGYYISGNVEAQCQDTNIDDDTNVNGDWNTNDTQCRAITCLESPYLEHGKEVIECITAKYLDKCNLVCVDGYYISGISEATCIDKNTDNDLNQYGYWDIGNTECTEILCTVNLPEHGLSNCSKTVAINTTCSFECDSGYSANGNEQRICENVENSDGEWDINWESATCNDIDECKTENQCASNAKCENMIGSYFCVCNQGYSGDGNSCVEIEEQTTVKPPQSTTTESESSTIVIVSSVAGVLGVLLLLTIGIAIHIYRMLKSEQKKIRIPAQQEIQVLHNQNPTTEFDKLRKNSSNEVTTTLDFDYDNRKKSSIISL